MVEIVYINGDEDILLIETNEEERKTKVIQLKDINFSESDYIFDSLEGDLWLSKVSISFYPAKMDTIKEVEEYLKK